ncbi:hypothetical protein [Microbacterium sp. T2.11-28]|uniref:hypothetical protein n=1 Tax=Microbacterium sp. T2.11-28 TaxID=3041169 RepID=UPI00247763F7|nr:hypothetical protein [Microbacterium sp. T2.11-28]CAI9388210.1 hypothetical protein MICABA_02982 [Microbacterium sp. T2.11-28]
MDPIQRSSSATQLLGDGPLDQGLRTALDDADAVAGFGTDVGATLSWAVAVGAARSAEQSFSSEQPFSAEQSFADEWSLLAAVAARDVAAARILEPHLDALTILGQAGRAGSLADLPSIAAGPDSSWGVFAAEGAGMRLEAQASGSGWRLNGTKPWCSLAQHLSHALVTAWVGEERRLFAVALQDPGAGLERGRGSPEG